MAKSFNTPDEIAPYGRMVQDFNLAMKTLAEHMQGLGFSEEVRDLIVGDGRYNNLKLKNNSVRFARFGEEQHKEGRGKFTGLFGAFYFVHLPELFMSLYGQKLLADKGCKLRVSFQGRTEEIKLDEAHFTFRPRTGDIGGQIVLAKELSLGDNPPMIIAAGTPLTVSKEGSDYNRKWLKEEGTPQFDIIDGRDPPQSLHPEAAISMLWGIMNARGFKKYKSGSPEFLTLALDGVDDDVTAEEYMIKWLNSVREHNGIDLMPQFNRYVQEAHTALNDPKHLQLREAIEAAIELPERIKVGIMERLHIPYLTIGNVQIDISPYLEPQDKQRLEYMQTVSSVASKLRNAVEMLDLHLPETISPAYSISKEQVSDSLTTANIQGYLGKWLLNRLMVHPADILFKPGTYYHQDHEEEGSRYYGEYMLNILEQKQPEIFLEIKARALASGKIDYEAPCSILLRRNTCGYMYNAFEINELGKKLGSATAKQAMYALEIITEKAYCFGREGSSFTDTDVHKEAETIRAAIAQVDPKSPYGERMIEIGEGYLSVLEDADYDISKIVKNKFTEHMSPPAKIYR